MIVIKTPEDITAAAVTDEVKVVIMEVFRNLVAAYVEHGEAYDPDEVGYIVVVEGGDEDQILGNEINYSFREALLEGVCKNGNVFETCTLHNNEYGITWLVIDSDKLDSDVRKKLQDEVDYSASQQDKGDDDAPFG
jgi:hypothetical protein